MANPERGEVPLTVDGTTYTLKLSMNAAAVLQGRTKKTVGQLLSDSALLDFVAIRSIVWMLLQKHHAKDFKTEDQVGDFIDSAGGLVTFTNAINEVVRVNEPEGERTEGNPPTAQAGTSGSST